nr:uncharacterized protein LOC115258842 [Aedes albopictus]
MVSRGVNVEELINSDLWKVGPLWLRNDKSTWPSQYFFRFCYNSRKKARRNSGTILSVTELQNTKAAPVKLVQELVQAEAFPENLKRLKKGFMVSNKPSLRMLSLVVDAEGLMRIGGRLRLSDAPYDIKNQMVLSGFHLFIRLLLKHYHRKLVPGGIRMTLSVIRNVL